MWGYLLGNLALTYKVNTMNATIQVFTQLIVKCTSTEKCACGILIAVLLLITQTGSNPNVFQ